MASATSSEASTLLALDVSAHGALVRVRARRGRHVNIRNALGIH